MELTVKFNTASREIQPIYFTVASCFPVFCGGKIRALRNQKIVKKRRAIFLGKIIEFEVNTPTISIRPKALVIPRVHPFKIGHKELMTEMPIRQPTDQDLMNRICNSEQHEPGCLR